jgi:hypothetical protein
VKPKTVYVEQYGYFWKFTFREWLAFVKDYLRDPAEGYMLPNHKILRRRSPVIEATYWDDHSVPSYHSRDPGALLVQPLDWGEEEFKDHLKELES